MRTFYFYFNIEIRRWRAKPLTREHKPESKIELARIEAAGGKKMYFNNKDVLHLS